VDTIEARATPARRILVNHAAGSGEQGLAARRACHERLFDVSTGEVGERRGKADRDADRRLRAPGRRDGALGGRVDP
jgi:hypothetical protein